MDAGITDARLDAEGKTPDQSLPLVNACATLTIGLLGLGTCAMLYFSHLQFQEDTAERVEGLKAEIQMLREEVERTRVENLGRTSVAEF